MAMNLTIDRRVILEALAAAGREQNHVAVVVPADPSLDGGPILEAMPRDNRVLWWQPSHERMIAGAGVAVRIKPDAAIDAEQSERFRSIGLEKVAERIVVVDPYETGHGPRLIGAFSFFADDAWPAFGSGELQLPTLTYIREGRSAAWVVVLPGGTDRDPVEIVDGVVARIRTTHRNGSPGTALTLDEPGRDAMRDVIVRTIDEIDATAMEKVVVARSASAASSVDVTRLVDVLAHRYPECATFAFERGSEWFCGSTPELLIARDGSAVMSAALAATAPRQADPVLDQIELESLTTTKQLEEHRYVVEAIVGALQNAGVETNVEAQRVLELRQVRHLETVITGTASEQVDLLALVGDLHPTPAVGGVPGSGALQWIRKNETFSRGWYAAPVGIVDLEGNGEFRVALRSARISDGRVHLYAGAGIVAGSDPDDEMAEIDLKLGVMAGAVAAAE